MTSNPFLSTDDILHHVAPGNKDIYARADVVEAMELYAKQFRKTFGAPPEEFGASISEVLGSIHDVLWERDFYNPNTPPRYPQEALKFVSKISMSVIGDALYTLIEQDELGVKDSVTMALKLGEELRKLIKTYTGVDTHALY